MKIFLLVLREIHTFAASLIIKIKKYETVYNEPNDLWGWHYFYAHLIQEPSLIHYRIAWLIPIMELTEEANHPSDL